MSQDSKILVLEPYFHGSHRYFIESLRKFIDEKNYVKCSSDYSFQRGLSCAALEWSSWVKEIIPEVKVILCTSSFDLASLVLLVPEVASIPKVYYFHESQGTYPRHQANRNGDHTGAYRDLLNYLAADHVWFNSAFHQKTFRQYYEKAFRNKKSSSSFSAMYRPKKERVMPIGIRSGIGTKTDSLPSNSLTILWNHRWDYDKNPAGFFKCLQSLSGKIDFKVVLLGGGEQERIRYSYKAELDSLQQHIVYNGYCSAEEYSYWLRYCDIVISTAYHEFYGISVIEAIAAGCIPVLPNRLNYPDIIPESLHNYFLYNSPFDLVEKIILIAGSQEQYKILARSIDLSAYHYDKCFADIGSSLVNIAAQKEETYE